MNRLSTRKHSVITCALLRLLTVFVCILPVGVRAGEYLSAGEVMIVSGGTVAATLSGMWLGDFDSTRTSLIRGAPPIERSIQRFLGGEFRTGKSNFLNGSLGSAYTPVSCGVVLAAVDAAWPPEEKGKSVAQDLFLYTAGLLTTKGITSSFKGAFARPRPYVHFSAKLAEPAATHNHSYDHSSFFSGHASAAFFATTFLNKRLRSVMRRELMPDEYGDWSWISPAVLYSWSVFVGWTRIHAYEHYITDVLIGAVAGYLLAELFYSFGYDCDMDDRFEGQSNRAYVFRLSFSF